MDFLMLWKAMCSFVSFLQLYHFDGQNGVFSPLTFMIFLLPDLRGTMADVFQCRHLVVFVDPHGDEVLHVLILSSS
jgi:hypothetical protein